MKERNFITRGIYLSYLKLFLSLIVALVLTPILTHGLGNEVYGIWLLLNSIFGYFLMFDFGMNVATAKYVAEYQAKKQKEELNKLVSAVIFILFSISCLILLVCVGMLPFIPKFFRIPKELSFIMKIAFLIMAANVVSVFLSRAFGNILLGYQRVDITRAFSIIQIIANASFVIAFLHLGFGLIGAATASILSNLLLMLMYIYFIYRHKYGLIIKPGLIKLNTIKEVAPYSIRSFGLGITSQILYRTDSIVIAIFLSASHVTPYGNSYKLTFLATYFFSAISSALFPTFTKLYALGNIGELRALYLKISRISVAIAVPLVFAIAFWGESFINLWIGPGSFVGTKSFLVFVIMIFIHGVGTPAGILLQSIGKNKKFIYSEITNAGLNLLLSVLLVQRLGLFGVALGTLGAHLCTSSWIVPLLASKYIKLPVKRYILSGILPPVLTGIPVAAAAWFLVRNILPDNNFLYIALESFISIAIYIIAYLIFGATNEERQIYLHLIPKTIRKYFRWMSLNKNTVKSTKNQFRGEE